MSADIAKTALVTGATGFIGRHLAERLLRDGWTVHAVVRPGSNSDGLRGMLGGDRVHVHDGETESLLAIVTRTRPGIIFHVASLFLAQHRTSDVSALVGSNVQFRAQLAEAAAVAKVPAFINTGTSWQHYSDADFNPVNLYAATKQAFADMLRYYAEAGAFRAVTLELFDTYGPGDTRPKLFHLLRKTAQSGEPLEMSAGEQLIDLVYVDDVIEAYLAAARLTQVPVIETRKAAPADQDPALRPQNFSTHAISSGRPLRLRDLVETWQRVTGRILNIHWGARPYRPREVMTPWSRGTPVPGWQPRVGLEEGIRRMEAPATP